MTAVGLALSDEPPFKLGEHCKFCPAKGVCPLLVDNAFNLAIGTQYDLSMLPEYLARAELAEEWAKGVRQLAQQRLEAGHKVEGWKIVAKQGRRHWIDHDAAKRWAQKKKIPIDVYMPRELLSPAQMEKAVKKFGLRIDDAPIATVSSGTTLVPESDSRPAVSVSITALAEAVKRIGKR